MLEKIKTKIKNSAAAHRKDFLYLLVIANMIIWFTAYSSGQNFYEEYVKIADSHAQTNDAGDLPAEEIKRGAMDEFYYRFEEDVKFRNYVLDIRVKRNNPGNLRFGGQPHATDNNGFAEFPNSIIGFRALIAQLAADQARNLTLQEFITRYSPPSENDTPWLIKCAADELGVGKNINIKDLGVIRLAQYITKQEHGIKF